MSLALLARIEQETGDLVQAERALRQAIEVMDRIPGPLAEEKATLHNNLGKLLELKGDLAGAERHYLTALKLRESMPGFQTEARFALLLNLAGLADRAAMRTRLSISTSVRKPACLPRRGWPGPSWTTTSARCCTAWGACRRRRHADGGRRCLLRAATPLPLASLQHNLGTIELQMGQLDAAATHLREAETRRRSLLGNQHR